MPKRHARKAQGVNITPVEFHILLALADTDRHGYAIMQQVAENSGGTVELGPGTLYGAIKRLLDYAYIREVESRVDPDVDDSRRRYYRLTAAGRSVATAEAERLADLVRLARTRQLFGVPVKGGRS